jgi:glutathione S-transferase
MRETSGLPVPTLYDAARCPYCARVRIVLAEKDVPYEPVEIDLSNRPAWLYEKNPAGKVPVLEEQGFVLPESRAIMEYLEERHPEPPLLPADPRRRALARAAMDGFENLARGYYATAFRGEPPDRLHEELGRLETVLAERQYLAGREFSLADIAYLPWIIRAEARTRVDPRAYENLARWLDRCAERPSVAAELELTAAVS